MISSAAPTAIIRALEANDMHKKMAGTFAPAIIIFNFFREKFFAESKMKKSLNQIREMGTFMVS